MTSFVLASGSPQRLKLCNQLGIFPLVDSADIDETSKIGEDVAHLVGRLAFSKASVVAQRHGSEDVILAADSLVALGGRILGKPADAAEAATMIAMLSGSTHEVLTGHCIIRGDFMRRSVERTRVAFRDLTTPEIEAYVDTEDWVDKAGACSIQGFGEVFVDYIEGSYSNVIGLSLGWVATCLTDLGCRYFDSWAVEV